MLRLSLLLLILKRENSLLILFPNSIKSAISLLPDIRVLAMQMFLDLTNAFNEEKVIYTSEPEDGGVVSEDTVKYNKSYKYIHRVQPTLTISQVNGQGKNTIR